MWAHKDKSIAICHQHLVLLHKKHRMLDLDSSCNCDTPPLHKHSRNFVHIYNKSSNKFQNLISKVYSLDKIQNPEIFAPQTLNLPASVCRVVSRMAWVAIVRLLCVWVCSITTIMADGSIPSTRGPCVPWIRVRSSRVIEPITR